jgi:hypothetical protein
MAFQLDATAIAHVSMNPAVRDAAAVGAGLIELWPLTDAKQMDNDTKYGENLQVRMTRMAARVMTGDDVTVPDAEFVYEGADEIPGRPQRIVDALLAANDAYDEMGDYSETGDTRLIMRGAGQLGVDWDDDTVHAIAEALEAIEQAIADHYRDNHLGTEAVHQVLEQFGYDRMFYVLANTVRQKDWDGRISRDNKAWAKTIPVYENPDGFGQDRNVYFVVDRSHPGLTDLFLTQARKEYALSQEKKPSVRDSLNKNAGQQTRAEKPKQHKSQER